MNGLTDGNTYPPIHGDMEPVARPNHLLTRRQGLSLGGVVILGALAERELRFCRPFYQPSSEIIDEEHEVFEGEYMAIGQSSRVRGVLDLYRRGPDGGLELYNNIVVKAWHRPGFFLEYEGHSEMDHAHIEEELRKVTSEYQLIRFQYTPFSNDTQVYLDVKLYQHRPELDVIIGVNKDSALIRRLAISNCYGLKEAIDRVSGGDWELTIDPHDVSPASEWIEKMSAVNNTVEFSGNKPGYKQIYKVRADARGRWYVEKRYQTWLPQQRKMHPGRPWNETVEFQFAEVPTDSNWHIRFGHESPLL